MNSKAIYTEPVNRIKQKILFNDYLLSISNSCSNWQEFVSEVYDWGFCLIYKLDKTDINSLTSNDIKRLDQFIKNQSSEYFEEEEE